MKRFIDTHRTRFGVEPICRVLQFAPSTYYAACKRRPSVRQQRDEQLSVEVQRIHRAHFGVYGARKVWCQLLREGMAAAPRCTDERLMRTLGLSGAVREQRRRTTVPAQVPAPLDRGTDHLRAFARDYWREKESTTGAPADEAG